MQYDYGRERDHVHEYRGITEVADGHRHAFSGVTSGEIEIPGGSHYHRLRTNTTIVDEHYHRISDRTGPAIRIDRGRHIHFVRGETSFADRHEHDYRFDTSTQRPMAY